MTIKVLFSAFISLFVAASCTKEGALFEKIDSSRSGVTFKNQIFESENINIIKMEYVYNGGSVITADFDNDGLTDLFFTGNMVPNQIYLNKGDFEFENISDKAGVGGFYKWKSGAAVVDINGDGWNDIYVCATISPDSLLRQNMLFVNQGLKDGVPVFEDKASEYGIDDKGHSSNAGFFDYDNDGDLDLYILTNSRQYGTTNTYRKKMNDGTSTNTDKLYRNDGNGKFTDVTKQANITCEGYGLGLAFLDVNKDGWQDVYVGNDYVTNDLLYVNNGDGTFTNRIDEMIKHQSKFSMGNDVVDVNNDGFLDIITLDMLPESYYRKKTVIASSGYISYINDKRFGYTHQHARNMLQLNNGNGTFSEIGQLTGVYQTEWSWSPLFADYDNDGDRDLLITNGFPKDITDRDFFAYRQQVNSLATTDQLLEEIPSVKVPNYAFKNNGNLAFENVTDQWGMNEPSFSNGAAYADLDNDGDLDYVVSNINDVPSIYKNNLVENDNDKKQSNYIRIKLIGSKFNPSAIGSKITIWHEGKIQYDEHNLCRGYISNVEDYVHFGLGSSTLVDSIRIQWPLGSVKMIYKPSINQVLRVVSDETNQAVPSTQREGEKIFTSSKHELKVDYNHTEEDYIDFDIQRIIPRKYSQNGPGLAVGDVNGDDLDDFVIGGSANQELNLFIQNSNGEFVKNSISKADIKAEIEGLLLFDLDNDNDLDLYAVSGSYEFERNRPELKDVIYINDGKGNFKASKNSLDDGLSGSCVRAADFDKDGDLDLFVGGKISSNNYPFADESNLWLNENGTFRNVIKEKVQDWPVKLHVKDALWTDFDNDGFIDLIVAAEFSEILFFKNNKGSLQKITSSGIETFKGWYNSISGGDFDRDGDIDYVVGNLGKNNFYNCSATQPLTLLAKDFDGNGSIDPVLSCYAKSEDGTMKLYPVPFWEELNSQSPKFRRKFQYFREFAKTTTEKFFTPEELKDVVRLESNYLLSSYIENLGNGKFKITALPIEGQFAPVNGIVTLDANHDGNMDIVMIGNDYGNEPTFGQYDAFTGLLLLNDGKANFKPMTSVKSGFYLPGDAKSLSVIDTKKLGQVLLASQNRGSLEAFSTKVKSQSQKTRIKSDDSFAIFNWKDGKKQRVEFYFGNGYLSQSTRVLMIPEGVVDVKIYSSAGQERSLSK